MKCWKSKILLDGGHSEAMRRRARRKKNNRLLQQLCTGDLYFSTQLDDMSVTRLIRHCRFHTLVCEHFRTSPHPTKNPPVENTMRSRPNVCVVYSLYSIHISIPASRFEGSLVFFFFRGGNEWQMCPVLHIYIQHVCIRTRYRRTHCNTNKLCLRQVVKMRFLTGRDQKNDLYCLLDGAIIWNRDFFCT